MKGAVILAFTLLLLPPALLLAQSPQTAKELIRRGSAFYSKGNLDAAIADFTRALELDPESDEARSARARALKDKGDFDAAIEDFEHVSASGRQAQKTTQEAASAHTIRGNLRVNVLDVEGAISDFNRAISYTPANADLYIKRGEALLIGGSLAEAIDDFTAALALKPPTLQAAVALAGRGYARFRQGRIKDADLDFREGLKLTTEGKFFLTLHLKLLESRIRELRRRREYERPLLASSYDYVRTATDVF
jgi:tetratricopeptide (TPR) repeat protein